MDAGPPLALVCVSPLSSPKPLFVYLRGEHCLNAGRTLSTCGENCRLCSVQCRCKVKPVAPSYTKLRTTWGEPRRPITGRHRVMSHRIDQSQGSKLSRTHHRQTTDRPQTTDRQTSRLYDRALLCENDKNTLVLTKLSSAS